MGKKRTAAVEKPATAVTDLLRVPPGRVNLADYDPRATPGFPGKGKADAKQLTAELGQELSDQQERLFANGRVAAPGTPSVLLVLQGMDTSGKGGVIRHVIGMVDPQGVKITAFRAPTEEERRHPFLWRITRELPPPGTIGIFDRSHYEDVLVVRVNELAPRRVWSARYASINNWEAKLTARGTVLIKCYLHMSPAEQTARLRARLEDPTKHWKYNPGDVDERAKWPAYAEAYETVLERCHTDAAPWYLIPADRKWYRNWAVAQLLAERLRALGLEWPPGDFDVQAELQRLS